MLAFEVQSHSAFLSAICRDAANTCEVDTPVKPPDVLFSIFLGSVTHGQILKVWISLSFHDMSIRWCKTFREFGKYNYFLDALFNCIYYMRCMNMRRSGINSIRYFVIGNSYVGGSFFS